MTLSKTQFNCSEISGGTQPVTFTLKDVNNNSSSCAAQVTTKDNLAPTAVCENTTVQLGANGTVAVYPADLAADSFDNCSVWSYSPIAKVYTTAKLGNKNLTNTVKDWSGNAATCVSVVMVQAYANLGDSNGRDNEKLPLANNLAALSLYPNPTKGDATLVFQLPTEENFVLRVFDMHGRMVLSREAIGTEGENVLQLEMANAATGVYLIEIQSESLKGQKRLVVQR